MISFKDLAELQKAAGEVREKRQKSLPESFESRPKPKNELSIDAGSRRGYNDVLARNLGYTISFDNSLDDDSKTVIYARSDSRIEILYDSSDHALHAGGGPSDHGPGSGNYEHKKYAIPEGVTPEEFKKEANHYSWWYADHFVPWERRAYGAVIVNHEGKFLLRSPRDYFGGYRWTFAKGKMNSADENPVDVATREVLEETGIKGNIIGHVPGTFHGTTGTSNFFLMKAKSYHADARDKETWALKWATYEEAKNLVTQNETESGRKRDLNILHAAHKMILDMQPKDIHSALAKKILRDTMLSGSGINQTLKASASIYKLVASHGKSAVFAAMYGGGPPAEDPNTGMMGPGSGNYDHSKHTTEQVQVHGVLHKDGWEYKKTLGPGGSAMYEKGGEHIGVNPGGDWYHYKNANDVPKNWSANGQGPESLQSHLNPTSNMTEAQKTVHDHLMVHGWKHSSMSDWGSAVYTKGKEKMWVNKNGSWVHSPTGKSGTGNYAGKGKTLTDLQSYLGQSAAPTAPIKQEPVKAPGLTSTHTGSQLDAHKILVDHGWTYEKTYPATGTAHYVKGNDTFNVKQSGKWFQYKNAGKGQADADEVATGNVSTLFQHLHQQEPGFDKIPVAPNPLKGFTDVQVVAHNQLLDKGWKHEGSYKGSQTYSKPDPVYSKETLTVNSDGTWIHTPVGGGTSQGIGNKSLFDHLAGKPELPTTQVTGAPARLDPTTAQKLSISQQEQHQKTGDWKFLKYGESTKLTKYEHNSGTHTLGIAENGSWTIKDKATTDTVAQGTKGVDFNSAFVKVKEADKLSMPQKQMGKYLVTQGYTPDAIGPNGDYVEYKKGNVTVTLKPSGKWAKQTPNGKVVTGESAEDLQNHFSSHHLQEVAESVASDPQKYAHSVLTEATTIQGWAYAHEEGGNKVYVSDKDGKVTIKPDGSWEHADKKGNLVDKSEDVFDLGDHMQTLFLKKLKQGQAPEVEETETVYQKVPVKKAPSKILLKDVATYKHLSATQKNMHISATTDGWVYQGVSGQSIEGTGKNSILNYIDPVSGRGLKIQDNGYWSTVDKDGNTVASGKKNDLYKSKSAYSGTTQIKYKSGSAISQMMTKLLSKDEQPISELFAGIDTNSPMTIFKRIQAHGEINGWNLELHGKGKHAIAKLSIGEVTEDLPVEIKKSTVSKAVFDSPQVQEVHKLLSQGKSLSNSSDPVLSKLDHLIGSWKSGSTQDKHQKYINWMYSGHATPEYKLLVNSIATGPKFDDLTRNIALSGDDYKKWVAWAVNAHEKKKTWHMTAQGFSIAGKGSYGPGLNVNMRAIGGTHALDTHKVHGFSNEAEVLVAGDFEITKVVKDFDGKTANKGHVYVELKQIGVHGPA